MGGGNADREGAVTFIGSVSPPGGDLSEPVTQAALRVAGAAWALDPALAQKRVFPAIDLESSYSLFVEEIAPWMAQHSGEEWLGLRGQALALLQSARELEDIAALVGRDALQDRERFLLEAAALFGEVVLQQNAFDPVDASSSLSKTHALARLVLEVHGVGAAVIERGEGLRDLPLQALRASLLRLRHAPEDAWREHAERVQAELARVESSAGEGRA